MSFSLSKRSPLSDLRVLWHLLFHRVKGTTHAERLESFYGGQASDYDSFRARMLHGRPQLIRQLSMPEDGVWVDLGAGTGENILHAGEAAKSLREIHLVDLSQSLLNVARSRFDELGMNQVTTHLADATTFDHPESSVDLLTFSYSLTMIPDWFEAIALAERILKPGGVIAVTDFYVSRKYSPSNQSQHNWLRRTFWTIWFAADNVYLSGDHPAMLHRRFDAERFEELLGKVPYFPFFRAPYYLFIGRKRRERKT